MFVSTAFYDGEQALTKIMTTDDEENESFVLSKEMTKNRFISVTRETNPV
jgi:hypothetical protein